ncbi:MAG: aminotransferase [Gemmatimonadetes bacterium]|nr:aminotransferase [Gemmatimonadota bacterium]
MKSRLFIPGPTPIPQAVQDAMAGPIVYHRGPDFPELLTGVVEDAKKLFPTQDELFLLSSSGSGVMEAAVVNTLSPGDRVIVAQAGNFGARWTDICNAYGIEVVSVDGEWGTSIGAERIAGELTADASIKAVLTTQSETSTGAMHDIPAIGQAVADHEALLIVDGISSVCAHPLDTAAYGVDVALTGSQKGLGLPPGLAVMTLSQRAAAAAENAKCPRFYFDISRYRASLSEGRGPSTLPVTLISGLRAALDLVENEGIAEVWNRHARQAGAVREAIWSIGLECFADSPSNALTAVSLPESIDGVELMQRLSQSYGAVIGGGLAHLRGRVVRISNLGFVTDDDIRFIVQALEETLAWMGYRFDRGSAIAAADKALG